MIRFRFRCPAPNCGRLIEKKTEDPKVKMPIEAPHAVQLAPQIHCDPRLGGCGWRGKSKEEMFAGSEETKYARRGK